MDNKLYFSEGGDTGSLTFNPTKFDCFGENPVTVSTLSITKNIFQKEITIKGIRFSISIGRIITKTAGVDLGKKEELLIKG